MKVVIISVSPVKRDPRVLRQIAALQSTAELSVVGLSPLPDEVRGIKLVNEYPLLRKGLLGVLLLLRAYKTAASLYYSSLGTKELWSYSINPDVVIVNDINAMPIAERYLKEIELYSTIHPG